MQESQDNWTLISYLKPNYSLFKHGIREGQKPVGCDQILDTQTQGTCMKNIGEEKAWMKVHGVRFVWLLSLLSYQQSKVGCQGLLSLFCISLDMDFSLSFVQELKINFLDLQHRDHVYGFQEEREESVLLMISSIEIIILLFSSFSLGGS